MLVTPVKIPQMLYSWLQLMTDCANAVATTWPEPESTALEGEVIADGRGPGVAKTEEPQELAADDVPASAVQSAHVAAGQSTTGYQHSVDAQAEDTEDEEVNRGSADAAEEASHGEAVEAASAQGDQTSGDALVSAGDSGDMSGEMGSF